MFKDLEILHHSKIESLENNYYGPLMIGGKSMKLYAFSIEDATTAYGEHFGVVVADSYSNAVLCIRENFDDEGNQAFGKYLNDIASWLQKEEKSEDPAQLPGYNWDQFSIKQIDLNRPFNYIGSYVE